MAAGSARWKSLLFALALGALACHWYHSVLAPVVLCETQTSFQRQGAASSALRARSDRVRVAADAPQPTAAATAPSLAPPTPAPPQDMPLKPLRWGFGGREDLLCPPTGSHAPRILVLSPLHREKDLPRLFENLLAITYPHERVSVAFLISPEARDALATLDRLVAAHGASFARLDVFRRDIQHGLSRQQRHEYSQQLRRRATIARARNTLLTLALRPDADWVLWVDSDLWAYPPDIVQRLLSANRSILVPNCVMKPGGRSFDLNSWQAPSENDTSPVPPLPGGSSSAIDLEGYGRTGNRYLHKLRGPEPHQWDRVVRLDAVGGAMLLVRADLHAAGLNFPAYPFRRRVETEGLSMMGKAMGEASWGMPNVEVIHH